MGAGALFHVHCFPLLRSHSHAPQGLNSINKGPLLLLHNDSVIKKNPITVHEALNVVYVTESLTFSNNDDYFAFMKFFHKTGH